MTTTMIMDSIAKWKAIITKGEELVSYLDQGNRFMYENIPYTETSDYIHAYLGIYDDKLMFFLIPEAYDKEEYHDQIGDYTQVRSVFWTLAGSHTIPDVEADARMNRWIDHYKDWVPNQAKDPIGMFLAFNIPADDFESDECIGTLGLELLGEEGLMTADLIVANQNDKAEVQFDDYATPVPPYTSIAPEESFYLLQQL